jgi:hypothetical protein
MFTTMTARIAGLLGLVLVSGLALAHEGSIEGDLTLSAYELTKFLHVVLLVFWLGPEVAIMVAGQFATNTALSAAQRAGAARLMQYYELMPRVCMSLMLTVGGVLSEFEGVTHPWWQMAGIWLLGPVWLGLTLAAYFGDRTGLATLAERLEHWLRMALIVAIPISVAYSTVTGRLAEAPYVGGKLILFALILALGLLARRAFQPFISGVAELARAGTSAGSNAALDQAIGSSYRQGRLYVFGIWIALLLAALMGIVQYGAPAAS